MKSTQGWQQKPISLSKTKTSLFGILKTHKNKKVHESVTEHLGGKIEHLSRQNQAAFTKPTISVEFEQTDPHTCQCSISQLSESDS